MIILIDNYDIFHLEPLPLSRRTWRRRSSSIAMTRSASAGHFGEAGSDCLVARPCHAKRGRHLPRSHRKGLANHTHLWRVPRSCSRSARRSAARWCGHPVPMHGKLSGIQHDGHGVFRGINGQFQGNALPLAGGRAQPARRHYGHRPHRRRSRDGRCSTRIVAACMACSFIPKASRRNMATLILKNFLDLAAEWNSKTGRRVAAKEPAHQGAKWPNSRRSSARSRPARSSRASRPRHAFDIMMSGEATPSQIGGLLMALRVRGETVDEITGAVESDAREDAPRESTARRDRHCRHRRRCVGLLQYFDLRRLHRRGRGVKVAKHGNRALSSKSGAADVLTALWRQDRSRPPERISQCIAESR